MKIFKFTIPLIICIYGCQNPEKQPYNEKHNTFAIDETSLSKTIEIGTIFDSIYQIPLKYEFGLIGEIGNVRKYKNTFFVHDKSREEILIFKDNGKFENKVSSQGPGPKEYGTISFFDIDETNKRIIIFDVVTGKIIEYDYFGNYKAQDNLKIICRDFAVSKYGNYIFYVPDESVELKGKRYSPGIFVIAKNGDLLDHFEMGSVSYTPMLTGKSIVKSRGKHFIFSNYTNSIYEIHQGKIKVAYDLKFKNELDQEVFFNPSYNLDEMIAPFLKFSPYITQERFGFLFLQKNSVRYFDFNLINKEYKISKKIDKTEALKYFSFNGMQISKNEFATIINEGTLMQLQEYSVKDKEISNQAEEINQILSSNNGNPFLLISSFREN